MAESPNSRGGHRWTAPAGTPAPRSGLTRLLWFVGIYGVSLGAFTAVVYSLRALVPG